MDPIKCFFLTPTDESFRDLRRYASGSKCGLCPGGYHQASRNVGRFPTLFSAPDEEGPPYERSPDAKEYEGHPDWPTHAPCGYEFLATDRWQIFTERIYTRSDGGETTLRDAPTGAMWDAWWYPWKGSDGRSLVVKCPGGSEWCIDSRANNCTLPNDKVHRCWVRHGEPPEVTVDKNGLTCRAGAGSIQTSNWHGFLEDGFLTEQRRHG